MTVWIRTPTGCEFLFAGCFGGICFLQPSPRIGLRHHREWQNQSALDKAEAKHIEALAADVLGDVNYKFPLTTTTSPHRGSVLPL